MSAFRRKYATATHVYIPIIKRGVVDYAVGADWTPASGDVKVVIDGTVSGNIGTLPTAITSGNTALWDFVFTTGEMTGKKIQVTISDSATKAVEDQCFEIETYGHASAEYQWDMSAANLAADMQTIKTQTVTCAAGVTVGAFVGNGTAAIAVDASGNAKAQLANGVVHGGTGADLTLRNSTAAAMTVTGATTFTGAVNFGSTITATAGTMTLGTVVTSGVTFDSLAVTNAFTMNSFVVTTTTATIGGSLILTSGTGPGQLALNAQGGGLRWTNLAFRTTVAGTVSTTVVKLTDAAPLFGSNRARGCKLKLGFNSEAYSETRRITASSDNGDGTINVTVSRAFETLPTAAAVSTAAIMSDDGAEVELVGSTLVNKADLTAWATSTTGIGSSYSGSTGGTINLVNTLTTYTGDTPQTGDSFARIGASGGGLTLLSTATAVAAIQSDTDDIQTRLPAALVGGKMDSNTQAMASNVITSSVIAANAIGASQIAADAIGASELAADAVTEIQSGLATSMAVAAVQTDVTTLLGRITSTLFSGITSLGKWLGAMAGKTADASTLAEINLTTAGATYDNTTDSLEAVKDSGVNVTSVNGHATIGGKDLYHTLWYISAVTAGQLPSGAGTSTEAWKDFGGTIAVTFTVDADGNRTGVYA